MTAAPSSDAPGRVARSVAANTVAASVANVANKVLMFAFYVVAARHLGVERYGVLQAGAAFVTMFSVFTDLGLGNITAREVARDRGSAQSYLGNSLGVISVATLLVLCLVVGLANLLGYHPQTKRIIYLLCLMLACGAFTGYFSYVFLGFERMYLSAVAQVLQTGILVAGACIFARGRPSPERYALLYVVAALVVVAYSFVVAAKLVGRLSIRFDFRKWGRLLRTSMPVGLAIVLVSIYYWNGHTMLQRMHGETSVGVFNAAFRLVVGACFAGMALSAALYPLLSRLAVSDRVRLASVFSAGLRYVSMLSLPVAVLAIPLARPVVSLVYGPGYEGSAAVLRVLVWWGATAIFSSLLSNYLLAANRALVVTLQCLVSLGVNLAGNFLLIPRLAETGGAVALVAAEVTGVTFLALLLSAAGPALDLRRYGIFLLRVLGALVPAVVVAAVLQRTGAPAWDAAALVGSVGTYFVMLVATRAVSRQDVRLVRSMLRRDGEAAGTGE
jgi:O-antigen/teichoic acid export membrane protein